MPLDDNAAGQRDQRHTRTQSGDPEPDRAAKSKGDFDEPVGQPCQCKAQSDDEATLEQRQRREFDDREKHQ